MKPLKLKMCAFGPYRDIVEIDFEKLGNNGVFLITGDTGSGKTTIFDAISFALFGVSSVSRRDNSILRSDFASDNVKTFVELEFMHKGILYKVERTPRYMRKKVRGSGNTNVLGDAVLTYLNEVITGDKMVTDKCVEILGINANQFKQIMMIAQGEFIELLLAKPKDRAVIFRKIFNTTIYKDISDILKDRYLAKKREYEDILLELNNYKKNIIWDKIAGDDILCSLLLEQLDDYNNEVKNNEDKLKEDKIIIDKNYEMVLKSLSEANLINDSIKSLDEAKERLSVLLKDEELFLEKEMVFNKNNEIIEKILPNYNELIRVEKSFKTKKKMYEDSLKVFNEINEKYKFISDKYKDINKIEKRVENLKKDKESFENKLSMIKEIEKLNTELNDKKEVLEFTIFNSKKIILEKFKERNSLVEKLRYLEEKFEKRKVEYHLKNKKYIDKYEEFLNAQAGILASTLKNNEECPVCGSLEHPKLAVLIENVFSKEDIDDLKNELEEVSKSLENIATKINDLKKDIEFYDKELCIYDYDLLLNEIYEKKVKFNNWNQEDIQNYDKGVIEKEVINIEALIKEKSINLDSDDDIDNIVNMINKINTEINSLSFEISQLQDDYLRLGIKYAEANTSVLNLDNDIKNLESDIKIISDRYQNSYEELGFDNEKEYLDIMLDKESLSLLDKEISSYKNSLIELRSRIKSLEDFLNDRQVVDISNLMEKKQLLEDERKKIDVSLKEINYKLVNNLKIYGQIECIYKQVNKIEQEVIVYKDLSDTANGSIAGKNKLEFEQYVQTNYFDRIIKSANKRFSYMTDERYLLLRKEESLKISDKLGLELQVMDNYTGKMRDVKSLSGGESFKAALSLALGMSDIIQEISGGIVVDAMFIDEGFGSLDDNSLESAMNAIMMLGQNDKIIGIISHVNELKQRIDKKIIVKKSNIGSSIEIIV